MPGNGALAREVVVSLTTLDGTGICTAITCSQQVIFIYIATAEDEDFPTWSTYLIFHPGSHDGAEKCGNVTANSDDLVESYENFEITMAPVTPVGTNFRLGRTEMIVTLVDGDGMLCTSNSACVRACVWGVGGK